MTASPEILDRLKAVDLFASLSDRDLRKVAEVGRRVDQAAGKEIVTEGGDSVGFHLVLSGEALVSVSGAGRPSLGPGTYFGEISVLDGKPRTASVTAGDSGVATWSITGYDFQRLLDDYPGMTRAIIVKLCARIRAAEARATQAP